MTLSFPSQGTFFHARLSAKVTEEDARRLQAALVGASSARQLLIDFLDAEDFEVGARSILTDMQRNLRTRGIRTVYLADRPIFRGLGLKVAHDADDDNACAAATRAAADAWLAAQVARSESALERIRLASRGAQK